VGLALVGFGGILSGTEALVVGFMSGIVGAALLGVGAVMLFLAFGLWNMEGWAWNMTMMLGAISITLNLVSQSWLGVIIPAIVMIYIWMNKSIFH